MFFHSHKAIEPDGQFVLTQTIHSNYCNKRKIIMALYDKITQSMSDRNAAAYLDLVHDDFVVVFHKTGKSFSKKEWGAMVTGMFANNQFVQDSTRCVHESDDILVHHTFMTHPDGTKEAVMHVSLLKDGQIIRLETGATSLN